MATTAANRHEQHSALSLLSSSSYLFEAPAVNAAAPPSMALPVKALRYHHQFNSSSENGQSATRKTMKSNSIPITEAPSLVWRKTPAGSGFHHNKQQHLQAQVVNNCRPGRMSDSGLMLAATTSSYPNTTVFLHHHHHSSAKRKYIENSAGGPMTQLLQKVQQQPSPQSYASSTASSPSSTDSSSSSSASLYFDPFYLDYDYGDDDVEVVEVEEEENVSSDDDDRDDSFCSLSDR
ncbi:hypothetical protein TYRP_006494 [Tyrophagus putrescentiae]|nr:hypothetical protein TYRP_006494 [Tyrophagus putrescentiae]